MTKTRVLEDKAEQETAVGYNVDNVKRLAEKKQVRRAVDRWKQKGEKG